MRTTSKFLSILLAVVVSLGCAPLPAFATTTNLTAANLTVQSAGVDDYPAYLKNAARDALVDPWNFYNRECTSFVAWRLNNDNGVAFTNSYAGQTWGDAGNWGYAAQRAGIAVNSNPAPGSVAWWSSGHVAWVRSVSGGSVAIDEYNVNFDGAFHNERNIPISDVSGFIHIKDLSNDKSGPSYSDFHVGEIGPEHFTAMAKVTDPSGVRNVSYAVWTENNGQDDLVWYDAVYNGNNGNYWVWIPYSEHKNEKGTYIVHMYAYDNAGNETKAGLSYRFDVGGPKVENFHAWELKDNRFTISASITSPNGIGTVRYAVWTDHNGQDDLVWYDAVYDSTGKFYWIYIPFSDHNNERGDYKIHLYAYDKGEQLTKAGISYVASTATPSTTVTEGTYSIRTKLDTTMGVDVAAHSLDNQANVWVWKWYTTQDSGPTAQKFKVKAAGDGSYYIIATHSDKAVEVYGAYTTLGANISQHDQNETDAQRWYFVENDDGTYTMRNKATGFVMDVESTGLANGTNISQYTHHGGDNQKFYLVPTSASAWDVSTPPQQQYTGSAIEPVLNVTAGGIPMNAGVDYSVSYANNVNAGTASATITGKGGFSGSKTVTFNIQGNADELVAATSISDATVTGVAAKTYTGSAITQSPAVKLGSATLIKGTDYELTYSNNVNIGTAIMKITGKGNYVGSKQVTFAINPAAITSVAVSPSSFTYNGKAKTPTLTVKAGSLAVPASDYTATYSNNVNAGTASVTVTGKGNFTGSAATTFKITAASSESSTDRSSNNIDKPAASTDNAAKTIAQARVTGVKAKTYTGKALTQSPTVKLGSKALKAGTDYALSYKNNTNAGTATMTLTGKGYYTGSKSVTFKIAKAKQPMTAKPSSKAARLKTLKKKSVTLAKTITVKKSKGAVSYKNASIQKAAKKFKVSAKKGTITVPKGTKKGTYKVKVKVTAKGNANYKSGSRTVTVKVTVK